MKKLFSKSIFNMLAFLMIGLLTVNCSEDEAKPKPEASFTTERTGTSIKFTNTSTNATTYSWDFGDGSAASTDESPTHDYGKFGAFAVVLTATGEGGEDAATVAIQVVAEITIDGDFSDWADIPDASVKNSANPGSINKIKVTSDLTNIYFYVEGSSALGGFISLYINADNDSTTGWAPKEHVFTEAGAATGSQAGGDFEIDLGGPWPGTTDNSYEVWPWVEVAENLNQADWSFEGEEAGGEEMFTFPVKTGNAYEFAVARTAGPDGIAETMSFKLVDVDINQPPPAEDWIETGYLPNDFEGWIVLELFK